MISDLSDDRVLCRQYHLGGDRNFCYLFADRATGAAAACDPGFRPAELHRLATALGLRITRILVTHGHGDHVGGLAELVALTGATVHAGAADDVPGAEPLADGQELSLGDLAVRALATPGHSPGHYCFLCAGRLVTGDILFCGKVGGTGPYFRGSSAEQEYASLQKLLQLPDETIVLPGHDYYGGDGARPHSTIGHERRHNPFLTAEGFGGFVHLKDNWAAYKQEHGIR
ncbi:MBL fold metallo-hydrolase [bacterium]|nr:MBL fold metallo-hydrolase [bacterium]